MENWKSVDCLPDYGGVIEVSDIGRVRVRNRRFRLRSKWGTVGIGTKPDQMISGEVGNHGYRVACFYIHRKRHRFLIHRLIAKAFVAGYRDGLHVNHINGDKTDNRARNLEWVTNEENVSKAWQDGLVDLRGEKHPGSKLSDANAREIMQRLAAGEPAYRMGAEYGVSDSLIFKMKQGRKRPLARTT